VLVNDGFIVDEIVTTPVPFGVIFISTLASPPVAERVGPPPDAALATVNSF